VAREPRPRTAPCACAGGGRVALIESPLPGRLAGGGQSGRPLPRGSLADSGPPLTAAGQIPRGTLSALRYGHSAKPPNGSAEVQEVSARFVPRP